MAHKKMISGNRGPVNSFALHGIQVKSGLEGFQADQ